MPAPKNWDLLWSVSYEAEHDVCLKDLPARRITGLHLKSICNDTKYNGAEQKVVRYAKCTDKKCGDTCLVRYRLTIWTKRQRWFAFQESGTTHIHAPYNETSLVLYLL